MYLKYISESKNLIKLHIKALSYSTFFLIVLISIYLQSILDFGPDSSVYLDVGKKLAQGQRYYHDIFEINFPILMWNYALQYKIADFLNINPIILCQFLVYLGAIISIYFSAKILRELKIFKDDFFYYAILFSFVLGFFLRPFGLHLFEIGTKTSYFLMLFFPYLAIVTKELYQENIAKNSFLSRYVKIGVVSALSIKTTIIKGIIMALIVSLKPHYIFFVLIVEIVVIWQSANFLKLFTLDKLVAIFLLLFYVALINYFHREFFYMVVPLWSQYFGTYNDIDKLIDNIYSNLAYVILPFMALFFVYTRFKIEKIDIIFMAIFSASSLVILLENIFTIDQYSLFCALNFPFIIRIFYIILSNNFINFKENLFFLGFFILVPLAQNEFIRLSIFGFSGAFNIWWVMLLWSFFEVYKKSPKAIRLKIFTWRNIAVFLVIYLGCFVLTIKGFDNRNFWLSNFINLAVFYVFYFIFERYFYPLISPKINPFAIFMVMASLFTYIHDYTDNFRDLSSEVGFRHKFRKIYDFKAYYHKIYANRADYHEINFFDLHQLAHPFASYFKKEMPQKISIYSLNADNYYNGHLYNIKNNSTILVYDYIFRDLEAMLKNPHNKLIFVDNYKINQNPRKSCVIGYIEYILKDKNLRKIFLQNYRYENRLIVTKNYEITEDLWQNLFANTSDNKYKISGNFNKIYGDIEVYVRVSSP